MATIAHSTLTGTELHEPKGVSAATANSVYAATGGGSGTWTKITPLNLSGTVGNGVQGDVVAADGTGGFTLVHTAHGMIYFYNIASPYTLAVTGTGWQKVNPTMTASGHAQLVGEGTAARLTYIGTQNVDLKVAFHASASESAATNTDLEFAIYKNGAPVNGGNLFFTAKAGEKFAVSSFADLLATTNDYFEVYAKNHTGTGNIQVYTLSLMVSTSGT